MSPDVFWTLTPWQFSCCCDGYAQQQEYQKADAAWIMWNGAVLNKWHHKMGRFPSLKDFLPGAKKRVKRIDEGAIIRRLKKYQERKNRDQDRKA